jgi:hypothetical protein
VIAVLIGKAQELEQEGHALEFLVPPEQATIARVFEIVQIGQFITVHERVPAIRSTPEVGPEPGGAAPETPTEGHPVE